MRLDLRTVRGLAAVFGTVFAVGAIAIAAAVYALTRYELYQAEDRRLLREYHRLMPAGPAQATVGDVARRINDRRRERTVSEIGHRLTDRSGRLVAGTVTVRDARPGIANVTMLEKGSPWEDARGLTVDLPDAGRLTIVAESESAEEMGELLWPAFGLALALAIAAGIVTSIALGRAIASRLSAIGGTATAITAGDHSRRVPIDPLGGFFADQARIFNRMLDRIEELMGNLRQVSSDLAHDLRTPLTRLRSTLRTMADEEMDPQQRNALLQSALRECDSVLAIFTALLKISEVEAGQRRRHLVPLRLDLLADDVVESFAPEFADSGSILARGPMAEAPVLGDADLINQLLVNLVENAMTHAGDGATTTVAVEQADTGFALIVRDDGPGIPIEEHGNVLRRFVRLERGRSSAGHGLGLSLVAAIAQFHDGILTLADAGPGLCVRIDFPVAGRAVDRPPA